MRWVKREGGGVEEEGDNEWLKLSYVTRPILILSSDGIQQSKALGFNPGLAGGTHINTITRAGVSTAASSRRTHITVNCIVSCRRLSPSTSG